MLRVAATRTYVWIDRCLALGGTPVGDVWLSSAWYGVQSSALFAVKEMRQPPADALDACRVRWKKWLLSTR